MPFNMNSWQGRVPTAHSMNSLQKNKLSNKSVLSILNMSLTAHNEEHSSVDHKDASKDSDADSDTEEVPWRLRHGSVSANEIPSLTIVWIQISKEHCEHQEQNGEKQRNDIGESKAHG